MKSNPSNSLKIDWHSPISCLFKTKNNKSLEKLRAAGVENLNDLLWITPLHVQILPPLQDFTHAIEGKLFCGAGKIISCQARPNFWARGKGRALLQNVTVVVKDTKSEETLNLRWFNAYSSMVEKIKRLEVTAFNGLVQTYQGQKQIINPEITEYDPILEEAEHEFKVQYPTINKLGPAQMKKIFKKIPENLWENIPETLTSDIRQNRQLLSLEKALKVLHAKVSIDEFNEDNMEKAKSRLIYEEFFQEQVKIQLRRSKIKRDSGIKIESDSKQFEKSLSLLPFKLTLDQMKVLKDIINDMQKGPPMMRLVQGDVGCGKTAVALCSAFQVVSQGHQVALMCPTESLAYQHFQTSKTFFGNNAEVLFLTGSLKPKEKTLIYEQVAIQKPCLIIGTHALIQEGFKIPKLALSIIDEQHKFGVDQRLKLMNKNKGSHCLIMTATPIPRSLSLTQYGDLDISTIKTMPLGRKGHKTKIVNKSNFDKFLSFFKTRMEMNEQAYVVVPAIEESETHDMENLHETVERFKTYFPEYQIIGLHGKLKVDEKIKAFNDFKNGDVDILIATSVIEVGLDVENATILAVLSPERFGLSSLHQLRGRVGRGEKPGFCFLVAEKPIAKESLERLKVIEQNTDGFKIAEEDLRIRGEGDLFGKDQSGVQGARKYANILEHFHVLEQVREDLLSLVQDKSPLLEPYYRRYLRDERVFSTV